MARVGSDGTGEAALQPGLSPELLEACRQGDREAFRALYEAYKDRVYSMAFYFFHGDAAAASDVTQQVFLKLIQGIGRYRAESAFGTWLYRIVVNACLDRTRRRRLEAALPDAVTLDTVADPAAPMEDRLLIGEMTEAVQGAISGLPPKLRAAVLLRYVDELSYAEMAVALHCSIGTVSSRLSRAHRLLAKALAPLRQQPHKGWSGC